MKTDFIITEDGRRFLRKRCGSGTILYPLRNGSETPGDGSGRALGSEVGSRALRKLHGLWRALMGFDAHV